MSVLLVLYLALVGLRAIAFIGTGVPIAVVMGVALLVLPLIGALLLVRELRFVLRANALVRDLGAEGGLPVDDLPRSPSGRPDRAAADAEFERYRAEAEAAPADWRSWLRLGLAYDASGDRRRAREAMRRAITLA